MSIINIANNSIDNIKWYVSTYYNANPNSFKNAKTYDATINNIVVRPKLSECPTTPILELTKSQTLDNHSNTTEYKEINFREEVSNIYKTSTIVGFKYGASIKKKEKTMISIIFDIKNRKQCIPIEIVGDYHYSSLDPVTITINDLVEVAQSISIPPKSRMKATLLVYSGTFTVPVELQANLRGNHIYNGSAYLSSIEYTDNLNVHHVCMNNASALYKNRNQWPGYSSIYTVSDKDRNLVRLIGEGKVKSTVILYSQIHYEEQPLSPYLGEYKKYSSPLFLMNAKTPLQPHFFGEQISIINPQ
ncbi:ETX/MTX2 family pore-forming toxin [Bacillus paranthracis]|uniref:ETX/MTX2 family pore-forming toxin n=1 Tax=Bacillus paranthracis TaxID=2026186 RepID=A0AAJ1KFW7_9BACI|nr:ETX/MTX2 family pore-forming toxin [Bacillus paranthracis]MDG0949988.1 ETX/MTX2 family pore-forming toxin [Bacillus paranthracis]MDG0955885.1 ETX/MTX2 family pore-forming toxin [Bacillus paranthracis]